MNPPILDHPKQIRVIHNLARSGGTLISRCIGSMEDVRLLSEIHPLGHKNKYFNSVSQYQNWYGKLPVEDWKSTSFLQSIDIIYQACHQDNKDLILRDWAHIDFIGPPARRPPGFVLNLDKKLNPHYELLHLAIARHPLEMWRSLRKLHYIIDNNISLEQYLSAYRKYLDVVKDFHLLKFEDFCSNSTISMQLICNQLKLTFDPGYEKKWYKNMAITGDVHNHSRAGHLNEILHIEIKDIETDLSAQLKDSEDYHWIINSLDYDF